MEDKKIIQLTEEEYLKLLNNQNKEYKLGEDLISQGKSSNEKSFVSAFDKFTTEQKRKEETFTYPVQNEEKKEIKQNQQALRPLISKGDPRTKSSTFEPYRIPKSTHKFIPSEELPKIQPIKTKENSNDKIIEKSIKKKKIKKKRKLTKLSKTILISLIVINLGISSALAVNLSNKVEIHEQTEQIKVVLQEDFDRILDYHNLKLQDIDKEINLFSKEFIRDNLFNFYLKTNKDKNIMDKLIQKMTDNEFKTFGSYIINEGYFYKSELSDIMYTPNYQSWENHMEAAALQHYQETTVSKGARA